MRTEIVKSESEKKAEIIKVFGETLDKHCTNHQDVWSIIITLRELSKFADEKRFKYNEDLPVDIRYMRDDIVKNKPNQLGTFDDITDDLQALIMLAGTNAEGNAIVCSEEMSKDLGAILTEFSC